MDNRNKTTENTGRSSYHTEEAVPKKQQEVYNSYGETEINLAELLLVYVRKWIILGAISLVAAVLVLILVKTVLNKSAGRYEIAFQFNFPGKASSLYPDGTSFSYYDFLDEENIQEVLDKNPNSYKSFSVDAVLKNLTISRDYEETKEGEKNYTGYIRFVGVASFFGTADNFRTFTAALVENIAEKIKSMAQNMYYYASLDSFDTADTFNAKLSYLSKQKEYIISFYNAWAEAYGQQYRAEYTMNRYAGDVETAFSQDEYNNLSYELKRRMYIFKSDPTDEINTLKIRIELLNDEYEDNQKKVSSLIKSLEALRESEKSTSTDISTGQTNEAYYYERIASLTERQVDIEREVENINIKIQNVSMTSEANAYLDKLVSFRSALAEQTNTLRKVATYVYNDKTTYVFDRASFKATGTKNAILFAGVAFVFMYLAAGFVIFIIESNEANKK